MVPLETGEVENFNRKANSPGHPRRRRIVAIGALVGALFLGTALLCVGLAARAFYNRSVGEVRAMQPWPSSAVAAADAVPPDLSDLGLGTAVISDARSGDTIWADGTHSDGVVAEYAISGEPVMWIAALRFDGAGAPGEDFSSYVTWAEESCASNAWAHLFGTGIIKCYFTDAHNVTLMHQNWIFDIIALGPSSEAARERVEQARGALVLHWESIK